MEADRRMWKASGDLEEEQSFILGPVERSPHKLGIFNFKISWN